MRNKKIWLLLFGTLLTSVTLMGCKMLREVDPGKVNIATPTPTEEIRPSVKPTITVAPTQAPIITMEPTENPVTIVVERGPALNLEAIVNYFYGEDKATLMKEGYLQESRYKGDLLGYVCDKDGVEMRYNKEYNLDSGWGKNSFSMDNMRHGGAAYAYYPMCAFGDIGEYCFVEKYPEIDLESCSREEAIAACAPLAQICGYGDAQVKAYAITEDWLEENTYPWKGTPVEKENVNSAPKPDYEYVSQRDIDIARESGNEQLAQELENKPDFYDCEDVAWTKEHEAYILVYNSMLNGRVLDDTEYSMYCVYVPLYDSIIHARADQPLVAVEGKEETRLMTQDEAIEKTIRYLGIEELEDITITGISMVYCSEYEKVNHVNPDLKEWTIDPCWKIDYVLSDRLLEMPAYKNGKYSGTVMLNAVDGKVL